MSRLPRREGCLRRTRDDSDLARRVDPPAPGAERPRLATGAGGDPLNYVVVSGVLVADAVEDSSWEGDARLRMLVAVPLKHGNGGSAPQQVEAPPSLVGNDLPRLRGGVAVLVAGSLAGQGCIEAATIKIGEDEPDGEDRA